MTGTAAVGDTGDSRAGVWGDYDDDGDIDLYLVATGSANKLYRNNGDDTFTDVTASPLNNADAGKGAAWADYDMDGDLDLYVGNNGQTNLLYRNDGGGTFVDATTGAGVGGSGSLFTGSPTWGDYDGDGDLDIFVRTSSAGGTNFLYKNVGDGTFTDDAATAGISGPSSGGTSAAWADADNDGGVDLYLTSGAANVYYTNDGDGTFTDASAAPLNDSNAGYGVAWGDYDNDGDLDLYLASNAAANRLFQNDGGTFTEIGTSAGVDDGSNSRGVAWADYDSDGDLDLYVVNAGTNKLYMNDGTPGDWLKVELEGVASNEFGLGATVKAYTGTTTQQRVVDGGSGYYSQEPSTVSFGLNGFATVDSVDVIWPNGLLQRETGVTKNAVLTMTEYSAPEGLFVTGLDFDGTDDFVALPEFDLSGGSAMTIEAWVKPDDLTTNLHQYIVHQEKSGSQNDFLLGFQTNGTVLLFSIHAGGSLSQLSTTVVAADYTDGNWHHIAGTYDGTTQRLYSDGVLIGETAKTGTMRYSSGAYTQIGEFSNNLATHLHHFDGKIDEVRLWSVGRTQIEIAQNMNGVLVGNETGLDAYWRFDEQVGAIAFDETSNGNDGALTNMNVTTDWVLADHSPYEIVVNAPNVYTSVLPGVDVDGEALTFTIQTNGTQGSAVVTNASTGAFTYTPTNGNGVGDSFVYRIDDGTTTVDKTVNVINLSTTFDEVASAAGVDDGSDIRSAAWGDYDGDGDLDLYLGNYSVANVLYRNNGNSTFTDQTGGAPLNDSGAGHTPVWGDYDNDGDLDIYLIVSGTANRLFRNDGGGTFTEQASGAGVADAGASISGSWGDIDLDGDLDLYVTNVGSANRMYSNDGDATFTDLGGTTANTGNNYGAAFGDYDDDGDLDLYVTSDAANIFYRNDGGGTFTDQTGGAPLNDSGTARGISWGDYDTDGDLDIYLANAAQANVLMRNDAGSFVDVSSTAGVNDGGASHGTTWADFDNDGDLDLYVTNAGTADKLYINDGDGTFTDGANVSGATDGTSLTYGVAVGDYDNDGDLDIYLAINGSNQLYRNNGNSNKWLRLTLAGTTFGDAAGAQVIAVTGSVRQRLDVDGGSGYSSQPSLPLEFGFGTTTTVDSLIVRWQSGKTFDTTNVATNQALTIEENLTLFTDVTAAPLNVTTTLERGSVWADYDGDGDQDLYTAVAGTGANKLFRNDAGTFVDVGGGARPVRRTATA